MKYILVSERAIFESREIEVDPKVSLSHQVFNGMPATFIASWEFKDCSYVFMAGKKATRKNRFFEEFLRPLGNCADSACGPIAIFKTDNTGDLIDISIVDFIVGAIRKID